MMNQSRTISSHPFKDKAECLQRPLCVDLDGTLLRTDLLFESLIILIKRNPSYLFLIALWLLKGRARLKHEIAQRVDLDIKVLPYHNQFLEYLHLQKRNGRQLFLVTASNEHYALAIARHLRIFSDSWGSDLRVNLKGRLKADSLRQRFGEDGFVYAGNSNADVQVWREARGAVLVNAPKRIVEKVRSNTTVEAIFDDRKHILPTLLRALRVHQWIKNLLLFVPLAMSHNITSLSMLISATIGFGAFSLGASMGYLLNDLIDLESDRHHPRKCKRPLARGDLPIIAGLLALLATLGLGMILASFLPTFFGWTFGLYITLSITYSFYIKRLVLFDVILLATLYTLRIFAGGMAIGISISFWLIAFSMFLFISLAMVKRYSELIEARKSGIKQSKGRGYWTMDLELIRSFGSSSGYIAVLVLALYINSDMVVILYNTPEVLWMVCPLLLYWISRIWLFAQRGQLPDDPLVFTVQDKQSLIIGLIVVLILLGAS